MDCLDIPALRYGDFTERLKGGLGERYPVFGSIELTERCNLRCVHCYINQPAGDREARDRELTLEQWRPIFDQLADAGCLWLLLTGGEIFLRSDFLEIYTYLRRKGFVLVLFTNATLITPEIAGFLREWRPFYMEVTLYGSTRETFERVTGVPGSFDRFMRGVELIDEAGIQYNLKSMIMTLNVHELSAMREYAEGRGGTYRFDAVIQPRRDGLRDVRYLRLSPEQIVDLDLADPERMQNLRDGYIWAAGVPKRDDLFTCGAGRHVFHITADGQLCICSGVRTPSYDLTRGTFLEGWNEFIPKLRRQKVSKDLPCIECGKQILCGQCPGFAELENGDPESVVDYLCQIGHLRAHVLDLSERSLVRHE